MITYTPVRLSPVYSFDHYDPIVAEVASVGGMKRENAIAWAQKAYGVDAAIQNDITREVEVV